MHDVGKNNRMWRHLPLVALALLGAVGGYCYYRFVGCASGACAITSNPYLSALYGGLLGALLGAAIPGSKRETDKGGTENG